MYGKNVTSVSNTGNIEIGKDAVGIFGENTVVTNRQFYSKYRSKEYRNLWTSGKCIKYWKYSIRR